MPLQHVHLRINDAATGQPTPVRLRVTDAAGNYFAPFGHAAEFPTGRGEEVGGDVVVNGERWAYIDGTCEIAVPPGELTIEAAKGPEFRPRRETINLPPGKMALRFCNRATDELASQRLVCRRHARSFSCRRTPPCSKRRPRTLPSSISWPVRRRCSPVTGIRT